MSKNYTGGLTITGFPTAGDTNWATGVDGAMDDISAHDHDEASGRGKQIPTAGIAADAVNDTKIRLRNAQSLRARNAADSADVDLLQLDSNNVLEIERVARLSSTETLVSSGAISVSTSLTILNGSSLAMTLAAGREGQLKFIVNINSTAATITPAATTGPNEVKLLQNGSVMYIYLSGEWRFVKGNPQGTTTNDAATAGDVGETLSISRLFGSALAVTTNVTANVGSTTSFTLTPGDWDLRGTVVFSPAATTNVTALRAATSLTTATLPATSTIGVPSGAEFRIQESRAASVPADLISLTIQPFRVSVSANTPVFLVAQATFTVSTMSVSGFLEARRIR